MTPTAAVPAGLLIGKNWFHRIVRPFNKAFGEMSVIIQAGLAADTDPRA